MTTELLGKAERKTNKQRARDHRRLARASAKLAVTVEKLLEMSASGTSLRFEDVLQEIEEVVDCAELRAADAPATTSLAVSRCVVALRSIVSKGHRLFR